MAEPGRTPLSRRPPGAPITHVLMGFRCPRGSRLASLRLVSLWVPRLDHSERCGFGVAASPCHPVALPRELLGPGLVPGSAMPLVSSSRFFASLWRFRFDGASFLDVTRLASPLSRFINTLSSAIGNVLSGDSHISVALRSVFRDVTCSFLWAAVPCFFVASHRVLGWEPRENNRLARLYDRAPRSSPVYLAGESAGPSRLLWGATSSWLVRGASWLRLAWSADRARRASARGASASLTRLCRDAPSILSRLQPASHACQLLDPGRTEPGLSAILRQRRDPGLRPIPSSQERGCDRAMSWIPCQI